MEILADGLGYSGHNIGVASPLRRLTTSWADDVDGAVLAAARRRKERTYPELSGPGPSGVLAGEIGGRLSEEIRSFLSLLAKAKARSEPPIMKKRAEQAWRLRWGAFWAALQPALLQHLCWRSGLVAAPMGHPVHERGGE